MDVAPAVPREVEDQTFGDVPASPQDCDFVPDETTMLFVIAIISFSIPPF
jgi:hypothetical protein